MEQVQRRFVTFDQTTLDISSITWEPLEKEDHICLPIIKNELVLPFFDLTKRMTEYYPIVENNVVINFRRRGLYESQVVLETDDNILRGLRPFENFITMARIMWLIEDGKILIKYDKNYFDSLTHQENIERLKLTDKKLYNLYITKKGDPFTIYQTDKIDLASCIESTITIPYAGTTDIALYAIT